MYVTPARPHTFAYSEVVHVTIEGLTFCLGFDLTDVHFRAELQHFGHFAKCQPIRTREIASVRL